MTTTPSLPLIAGFALSLCLMASAAALSEEAAPKGGEPDASAMAEQEKEQESIAKDLSPTLKPIYDLGDDKKGPRIKVDAWVDQKNLNYKVGDTITVYASPKKDAFITILNVGSSGRVAVIYPNHYQREQKVEGKTTVRIPSKDAKWTINVGGPAGVDLIKVIASKAPLTLKELESLGATDDKNPVITLGRSADDAVKDLSPQLKPETGTEEEPSFGVRNILVKVKKKE